MTEDRPTTDLRRHPLKEDPSRTVLADGARVKGYTVTFLALGGMSVVYLSELDGRPVVLKEVPADDTTEAPALISEKSLLERLEHPGILRYYDFFSENGYYYLVVDYVEGVPLSEKMVKKRLPVNTVIKWGVQLCDTFEYLHQQTPPIIYRDLKPANVILRKSDGRPILVDFGVARLHKQDRQKDTTLYGSVQTASPEHYGCGQTDERSDIYTLGMTLYLLLAPEQATGAGLNAKPLHEVRGDLPSAVCRVIEKSVEFEPEQRHQTMGEFRSELRQAVGLPEAVSPSSVPRKKESSGHKTGLPQLLLMGLLVALVAWGVTNFTATPDPPKEMPPKESEPGHASHYHDPESLKEANFPVDLFSSGELDDYEVVMLGEDIGLFAIDKGQTDRSDTIAGRLNEFYRQFCPLCGKSKLEPEDIKIGRHVGTNTVVLFYAHVHKDGGVAAGPLLLATATEDQALELETTPRFMAAHWRDLMRDTIQISRGLGSRYSELGKGLEGPLLRAREAVAAGPTDTHTLQNVLQEMRGDEAFQLRRVFQQISKNSPSSDNFQTIPGYESLRL